MDSFDPRTGGFFSARNIVVGGTAFFILQLAVMPVTAAQALLAGFLGGAALWLWGVSRAQLGGVSVTRRHRPRIFEGEHVAVTLDVRRGKGLPLRLLEVEDQFMASLDIQQRHLVPALIEGWEVRLDYERLAERHRGLYLLGPVRLRLGDPLGVFFELREVPCITQLTVYPKADPLPGYSIPGPYAPHGPSMDYLARLGQGEEILSVREYQRGDAPARVHWRTSARRGRLHVLQLNSPVQVELAVMIDLTRRSRLGLGAESSTEMAIRAAISILTRAFETRHRFSLAYAQREPVLYPTGSGLAHLHLLLDRLAILSPEGESDFWAACGPRALMLPGGSRAVFIVPALATPLGPTCDLVKRLIQAGIAVDLVLIDEREFIKIYHDQEVDQRQGPLEFELLAEALTHAGARIFPIARHQPALQTTARPE